MNADAILRFWFEELQPTDWWNKNPGLDRSITERFSTTLEAAARGELFAWRDTHRGRLAEIIVLDQFSRQIHRDTPLAFARDGIALVLAQEALRQGADKEMRPDERSFMYMPYMHSESPLIQRIAVRLFDQPGLEHNHGFAIAHRDIVERFGRFPHRNRILGRVSTPEETEFLKQPGSSF